MPRFNQLRAFLMVPIIATTSWYVLMLCALTIWNGGLRPRTDVLAMALGALFVGLPASTVITLVLALPVYALVRRTVGITLITTLLSGAIVGLVTAQMFWMIAHEWSVLSPIRGVLIGMTTAVGWWYLAGRPSRATP